MQPFIPARLRKALTFLRPRVPGGPVDDPADLPAALDPLFDDSFALAAAMRAQGGECYLIEMPGTAHGGVPFGYAPACRALMIQTARDLLNADAPDDIPGGTA